MEFRVEVEGLDRIHKATREMQASVLREIEKALFVCGKQVEKEAKKSILNGQKTGRIYKRGNVVHRASAPGEAPASDTGRLANSINTYLNKADTSATVVAGRGTVKYAGMLEFGTSMIAPRPFLFPALEMSKPFIRDRLNKAVRDAARKGGK